ncbi:hypothetical protein L208DRAFT_1444296 [Tricholoma matsutake]|nr:hypothetical protein L208DRAFT_1444296 [Tricholoma matsutake 945]
MQSDAVITKRLHVSGLTPAITVNDLNQRLSSFGTVNFLDGFGLLDGLEQPRKFGYITIETTPAKLARCLNLLSGSTWKGTKLRIGEAKPDFAERIALEKASNIDEHPKKKRKRSHSLGVQAPDMSLVTPENVAQRAGWTITPLGRILRPLKIRPVRPLPPTTEMRSQKHGDREDKKKKKRVKDPDCMARRRTIDMTRWGSVHLKGALLDMKVIGPVRHDPIEPRNAVTAMAAAASDDGRSESESEHAELPEGRAQSSEPRANPDRQPPPPVLSDSAPASTQMPHPEVPLTGDATSFLAEEKSHALSLLASLFGGKPVSEWVGREDTGSDIDEDEILRTRVFEQAEGGVDEGEEFEIVPMEGIGIKQLQIEDDEENALEPMAVDVDLVQESQVKTNLQPLPSATGQRQQQKPTTLKDLFAPREEDVGFSLLGHLDLVLELDKDIPFSIPPPTQDQNRNAQTHIHPSSTSSTYPITYNLPASALTTTYDPSLPLFFPSSTHPHHKISANWTKGVIPNWRDPAVSFFRTESEEAIREKWEKERGELTREWKRRWREAGKAKRRRGGGGGEGDD